MRGLAFWLLSQVSWLSDAELRRIQAALADTGAATAKDWGKPLPSYAVASRAADIPSDGNEVPIVFSRTIDAPGDLAYHELLDGRPYCLVLADPEQASVGDVEEGAGHESDETIVDPGVDAWLTLPTGNEIALEVCDPVQDDRVLIDLGSGDPVVQSNHVTPAWFDASATGGVRLDRAGLCTVPLLVRPGGYAITRDAAGNVHQIGAGPAAFKRHPAFRYGRRLASAHQHAMRKRGAA